MPKWVAAQTNARMRGRLAARAETAECEARSYAAPNVEACIIARPSASELTGIRAAISRPVTRICYLTWTIHQEGEHRRDKHSAGGGGAMGGADFRQPTFGLHGGSWLIWCGWWWPVAPVDESPRALSMTSASDLYCCAAPERLASRLASPPRFAIAIAIIALLSPHHIPCKI